VYWILPDAGESCFLLGLVRGRSVGGEDTWAGGWTNSSIL